MTFLSSGRTPIGGFALCVLASSLGLVCGPVAAQGQPVATTLSPVLVTATRFAEDANTLPFGVSVVTAEDIRKAGISTVNEAVMKLLGVHGRLDLSGGGEYSLDLRGFGDAAGSNQAVILDGVRINEGDLSGTRLAGIPIDAVDRIEVIRGSSAVLYGEGATGGAIVITTKAASGAARQSSARAYMALGSQALAEVRAGGTLVSGGFSLDVTGNKRTTDGHRDNFRSNVESLALTGQWRNEWLRIGARHGQDKLYSGLPGSLTAAEYNDNPRQTTHPTERSELDNHRNGLFTEMALGDWQLALDLGKRDKTSIGHYAFSDFTYDIEANNRSLRVRHSKAVGGLRNTMVAGIDRNEWTRVVRGSFGSTAEQVSGAVYLKDDLTLASGTHLSAGVRAERADKTLDTAPTSPLNERYNAWDLGVVQPLGYGTAVYARFGRSFRFANADEFSFTMPSTSVKPQTSRDLDLGARWVHQLNRAELRFYRNALRDEIGYDPTVTGPYGPGTGANVNFDRTLRQGVELELVHGVNAALQLRLNAAARQAKFTDGPYDGKQVALVPKRTVSFGADWQVFEAHRLNAVVNTVSSQYPDFANSCRMPAYTTVDLRYAHQQGAVELSLGVGNVTDKKYYTQAYGCAAGTPTSIYPEAGRSFVASVRVSL
jgi:iron complex outermembrane receptor protein